MLYLSNPGGVDAEMQRDTLDALRSLNELHLGAVGDPEIATRINSFEMAYRMQSSAPELMDLVEGVEGDARDVRRRAGQVVATRTTACWPAGWSSAACASSSSSTRPGTTTAASWAGLKEQCKKTDQASAALVKDLKQRGLLDDTLVIWGGEFGRTPMVQGGNDGRDHHPNAFTMWLAGGGVKPGLTLGDDRRVRLQRGRGQGPRPRPARDDPAPARLRPHEADLPLPGPRLPPDRRPRRVVTKLLA